MKFTPTLTSKLSDADAETVRQNVDQRINELQGLPAASLTPLGDFTVPNSGFVLVPHSLGRAPVQVIVSPPKVPFGTPGLVSGGIIIESTTGGTSVVDRTKQIQLFATGWGIPVTVSVAVM